METWPAYAIFRRGVLLYDRFFYSLEQAYLYKLACYSHMASEEIPAEEWLNIEKITIESVLIIKNLTGSNFEQP